MMASISLILPREPASQMGLKGPYSCPTCRLSSRSRTSATKRSCRKRIIGADALPAITVGTTSASSSSAQGAPRSRGPKMMRLSRPPRYSSTTMGISSHCGVSASTYTAP